MIASTSHQLKQVSKRHSSTIRPGPRSCLTNSINASSTWKSKPLIQLPCKIISWKSSKLEAWWIHLKRHHWIIIEGEILREMDRQRDVPISFRQHRSRVAIFRVRASRWWGFPLVQARGAPMLRHSRHKSTSTSSSSQVEVTLNRS